MWECVLLKEVCNNSSKMKGHTTTPEVIEVIFVFLLMSWSPAFTFVWPIMFQLVWRTPAWFSTCIYTSKHSGQRSIWQAFIVLATFLLLSDSVSKHICPAVQAICVCVFFFFLLIFPPPCCSQFMQWNNVCQIASALRSDHRGDVSHGCYGLKASCLKCRAVFVFPGGGWGLHWLHSAVAPVVDWLCHSPDRPRQCLLETQKCRSSQSLTSSQYSRHRRNQSLHHLTQSSIQPIGQGIFVTDIAHAKLT